MDIVEKAVPAGPVAVVDGQPISRASFLNSYRQYIRPLEAMAEDKVTDAERVKAGLQVLRKQLQEKVLLAMARKEGLSVSTSEVERAYQQEMKALQDAVLERTGESKTEEEVLGVSGRTRAEALRAIEEGMLIEKAAREIVEKTTKAVPDAEVKRIYEENKSAFRKPGGVHLSQIYIKPNVVDPAKRDGAFAEARKEAEKALARIRAGEKFETVAKDMSNAPDAQKGGDLGVRPEDALPPFYREALTQLDEGEMSGVIESQHGFHIIRLEGTQDADYATLDEARPQIEGMVRGRDADEAIYNFCQPIIADPKRTEIFLQLEKTMLGADAVPPELAPPS
jgi:parvulin-like peptidyl-prolyl isomerase